MQSFLITSSDKNLSSAHVENLLKKYTIDPLDINIHAFEKAVGIADIRNIQKQILLKPFRGRTKAAIIDAYQDITIEAQNALLKILEEPPSNTIVVITAAKKEVFLPTIVSRCKVITLQEKEAELTTDDSTKLHHELKILLNGKTGDKLRIAQDLTADKGDAGLWLKKMTILVKAELAKNNKDIKYLNLLKEIQKTYKTVESTNVSQRAALENLFLSF